MTGIIIALPTREVSVKIKNLLVRSGFRVVAICGSGSQALSMTDQYDDGIVICGYKLTDMLYTELHEMLSDRFEMLVIASDAHLREDKAEGIMSLSMPLQVNDLLGTVNMMSENIAYKRKKRHSEPGKRSREDLLLISEAKKLLMERNNMTEDEAHRYIQKSSMESGVSIVEKAQMILELFSA